VLVVLAGEQQGRPLPGEVPLKGVGVAFDLELELGVGGLLEQVDRGLEVGGPAEEVLPGRDLGSQGVGLAKRLLGGSLVVPEARLERQRIELRDPLGLGLEVKDAPTSIGSVPRGPGWRRRPPSCGPADPGAGSVAAR
jgi:hypothetical protein